MAAAFGFGGFVLSAMASFLEDRLVYFFAPLKFFDASKLFFEGGFDKSLVIWAAFIVLTGITASYHRFSKSDVHAV
jgi:hypothetical protein